MEKLKSLPPDTMFDLILSYSSTKHDGLGRYGDPINPNGDFAAVKEYHSMLNDEGYMILGIPTVKNLIQKGVLNGNGARIHSYERADKPMEGLFDVVGGPIFDEETKTTKDWQYHHVRVLKKIPL